MHAITIAREIRDYITMNNLHCLMRQEQGEAGRRVTLGEVLPHAADVSFGWISDSDEQIAAIIEGYEHRRVRVLEHELRLQVLRTLIVAVLMLMVGIIIGVVFS